MFNYMFDNTREYNEVLQFITLFLLVVIGVIIYTMYYNTDEIEKEIIKLDKNISDLELICPECPDITDKDGNKCPKCPRCPKCPDCNCEKGNSSSVNCPTVNCPSVEDIISGIFPGRNTGITKSGRYFDVQANENYELMPDYDFYKPGSAFPSDSILNIPQGIPNNIPQFQYDNSYENYLIKREVYSDSIRIKRKTKDAETEKREKMSNFDIVEKNNYLMSTKRSLG